MSTVLVNQSYATQQVTGQQRYAAEIAGRLRSTISCAPVGPSGWWTASAPRIWAWIQLVLPFVAGRSVVLSMTSRAPFWRRRHVLVVHDLFVLTNPEWFSRLYVWTHAPLLRAQIRSAAAIVAVSRPIADQLTELRAGQVAVAPNGPSAVFHTPPAGSDVTALEDRGLEAGSYFLTVGSRNPRKNLVRLAEAYGMLSADERRRHPLVVAGGGDAIYRDEQIDWPDGTVVAGYVTDDDLRSLYRGARCVAFPSLAEGFGLPLVEAAAAGTASLLVSDIEVFRWICGAHAHYVDPTSAHDIADGMRDAIRSPRTPEIDLERFSWDASASVIGDICVRIADRRRSA